ncbi:hypothetical protein [Paenibacillus pedocola]|uniref:hypothetical protein n=1 Tax=Paenibacillus pedocola TaxID=3242193 RepID=UPI00287749A5|nr:hypothetical protein [Paenibacillus typhae]
MNINDVMNLLEKNKIIFKESQAPIPNSLKNKVVKEQVILLLPLTYQVLHVYEFNDGDDLAQEKKGLLKKFKKEYFDSEVVAIETNNIFIVTSKDKGEKESKFEKQLKDIFLSEEK